VFQKVYLFPSSGEGETPTLLGPLKLVSITGPVTEGLNKVRVFPLASGNRACVSLYGV
jgi:hypothetical protein